MNYRTLALLFGFTSVFSARPATRLELSPQLLRGMAIERKLGQGALGAVFEVGIEGYTKNYALKITFIKKNRPNFVQKLEQQTIKETERVTRDLPYCVPTYGVVEMPTIPENIRENIERTNLERFSSFIFLLMDKCDTDLQRATLSRMSEKEKIAVCHDIALNVSKLHDRNIVHLDVKADNALIDTTGQVVMTDFGNQGMHRKEDEEEFSITEGKTCDVYCFMGRACKSLLPASLDVNAEWWNLHKKIQTENRKTCGDATSRLGWRTVGFGYPSMHLWVLALKKLHQNPQMDKESFWAMLDVTEESVQATGLAIKNEVSAVMLGKAEKICARSLWGERSRTRHFRIENDALVGRKWNTSNVDDIKHKFLLKNISSVDTTTGEQSNRFYLVISDGQQKSLTLRWKTFAKREAFRKNLQQNIDARNATPLRKPARSTLNTGINVTII